MASSKQPKESKRGRIQKQSSYRVFISHSSKDKWVAERMAEKIKDAGADYWLDTRDLPGGGDIRDEISKGVNDSREIVILFSPYSKDSPWVSFEIGAASVKGRYLTPILNNVQYSDIALIQGIKATELNDFDQYLSDLKERADNTAAKKKGAGKKAAKKRKVAGKKSASKQN
jgi:TIR domain-containing protein